MCGGGTNEIRRSEVTTPTKPLRTEVKTGVTVAPPWRYSSLGIACIGPVSNSRLAPA
jgi:hypothetical protein